MTTDAQGSRHYCKPIFTTIISLHAENNHSLCGVSGGLIDVGTKIDPTLHSGSCRWSSLEHTKVYRRASNQFALPALFVGVHAEDEKRTKVSELAKNELLLMTIGSTSSIQVACETRSREDSIDLPASTEIGRDVSKSIGVL